ncbi:TSUP family transporter, partial [Klebsiella pneumoniae]|nr:TSUP family transporter [Klebsiella pneumoniae]
GLGAGSLSGFFGIGGGFLVVPGLMFAGRLPIVDAIGTSLFAVGSFGLTTAVNYSISGQVDWLIAAEFVGGGVIGGWLGTRAASRLARKRGALN